MKESGTSGNTAEKNGVALFWFRRDLRLEDNAGLYHALKENKEVCPLFIFDRAILEQLGDPCDRRVDFIHQALCHLKEALNALGSSLRVFYGHPAEIFANLFREQQVVSLYLNHDYEPAAKARDQGIEQLSARHGVSFKTYKDQCIFERSEVIKDDGTPYTVFTPYSRKWKKTLRPFFYRAYPTERYLRHLTRNRQEEIPGLEQMGFRKTDLVFQARPVLDEELLRAYKEQRDYPALAGTSRLSIHLRFGTLSIRTLVSRALVLSETWLNELIWRDFYMMILDHFPQVERQAFKKEYDLIPWSRDEQAFEAWCEGRTGFPIVDAGMRELNQTGFMHNRVRMIVSSFLVKDLLIDWRWGEAYFAARLNDFDLSANNGGWQWAAGSGCDAAPYFRIFNPAEQQKKFDPALHYIRKWIPEFGTPAYPAPMIDHAAARLRTLAVYKRSLGEARGEQGRLF